MGESGGAKIEKIVGKKPQVVSTPRTAIWETVDEALSSLTWKELVNEIPGLGEVTASKLEKKYGHPITLAFTPAAEIQDVSPNIVAAIRAYLLQKFLGSQFITAAELARMTLPRLTTGVPELDDLLMIRPGDILLFYGPPAVGKTQLCHQLASTVQVVPGDGGYGGAALYIDTENTFSLDRIETITAALSNAGLRLAFENPVVYRYTIRDPADFARFVYYMLPHVFKDALTSGTPIRLLIVDSFIAPFREKYGGRGNLAARQQSIAQVLGFLKDMAILLRIPVVLTTQVVARPVPYGKDIAPAGGHTLLHNVTKIVEMSFVKERVRAVRLEKGGRPGTVYVEITDEGVKETRHSVRVE